MKYKIGTRGSKLSLAQTKWVAEKLESANPGSEYELVPIRTSGDKDTRPLFAINQRGIFEKEVDRAVSDGTVDFAVHSLKDVPSDVSDGLELACIPRREPANDVLVSKSGAGLDSIVYGATVGTSSLRRAVQLKRKRPDLIVRPIRGNIETRIQKISGDTYDGIVLARAGISRLGLDVRCTDLSLDDFAPSPGQGALAIMARAGDSRVIAMLEKIQDAQSRLEVNAERALSKYVESGCRFPVGAHAQITDDTMLLRVEAFSVDGKKSILIKKTGPKDNPEGLGQAAGEELQRQGVEELALNWREKVEEWNRQ